MYHVYARFIEEVMKSNPLFMVGSGLSAGAGISGMGALAQYLVRHVDDSDFEPAERTQWALIKEGLTHERKGLEQALQEAGDGLSGRIMAEIVHETWRCIADDEQEVLLKLACGHDPTGLVRLFQALNNSTNKVVHIVTTNYDHLVEWSASCAGWHVWDGFHEGPIGRPLSSADLEERMQRTYRLGRRMTTETIPHLRIYKPHGSLNWFKFPDGSVKKVTGLSARHLPLLRKVNITPVIVTPGTGKYLETHFEPYASVLAEMKRAVGRAKALVFVGFGFQDIHIQGSFEPILKNGAIPKLVLAKRLSLPFQNMAAGNGVRNYIAVQEWEGGSRVQSDHFAEMRIAEPGHWTLQGLLNLAWGAERTDEWPRLVSHE